MPFPSNLSLKVKLPRSSVVNCCGSLQIILDSYYKLVTAYMHYLCTTALVFLLQKSLGEVRSTLCAMAINPLHSSNSFTGECHCSLRKNGLLKCQYLTGLLRISERCMSPLFSRLHKYLNVSLCIMYTRPAVMRIRLRDGILN
jgi:hypothetical protein